MKSIFWTLLTVVGMGTLWGQNCQSQLHGKVVDKDSGEPLIMAKVKVINQGIQTHTDFQGDYRLKNLCNDTVNIKVSEPHSTNKTIQIVIDGDTPRDIRLDHHHEKLEEVLLVGNSVIKKSLTAQEQSISEEDIDKFSSGSLGDALKSISGVSTLKTGKNIVKPVVQGLSGSRVPVLNNGVRMEDQE